jgi:carotenoid cleavage dioxygenase-like enzyme
MSLTTSTSANDTTRTLPRRRRGFENLAGEHGFVSMRVEGQLPSDLRGTFYRNGPGRFDIAGERYGHWFDSDGAVTAVRLDGTGAALGASKLVATPWLRREREAGRRLYGAYGTPLVTLPRARPGRHEEHGEHLGAGARRPRLRALRDRQALSDLAR